jgi:hypothetical protein
MNQSVLTCLALAVTMTSVAAAEVQVNVRASGAQANAVVAADGNGVSVVVWSSYFTTAGRSNDILARRLDPNGSFIGDEFQVNGTSEGNQTEPAVAFDRRGNLAVVWQGPGLDAEDVFLRVFDPNGQAVSDDLLVNLETLGRQLYPKVAGSEGGTLVVAWESRTTAEEGDRFAICAQLFDANGAALGGEIIVDDPSHDCRYPDVAMDGAGGFVVTWLRETGADAIMARRFDPNGLPVAAPFRVSAAGISSITRPSIAMNSFGRFAIAWDGDPNRAGEDDIHARMYEPNAAPVGEPFLVNTLRFGAQQWPRVAINDANEFVVVWEHDTGDPDVATEIFARRLGGDGQPAAEPFQLNSHALDKQRYPDVAMTDDGSFIATWESNGQDGSGYGIFAHIEPKESTWFDNSN